MDLFGQSSMQWSINASNDPDLEKLTAHYPNIRLVTVPGSAPKASSGFEGKWRLFSRRGEQPRSIGVFRRLSPDTEHSHWTHQQCLGRIGCRPGARDLLEADARYEPLLERWKKTESDEALLKAMSDYEAALETWESAAATARGLGKDVPTAPEGRIMLSRAIIDPVIFTTAC